MDKLVTENKMQIAINHMMQWVLWNINRNAK